LLGCPDRVTAGVTIRLDITIGKIVPGMGDHACRTDAGQPGASGVLG
jgi:hypothetical protein